MTSFARKFRGRLWGVLAWKDLDALFAAMTAKPGWYAWMLGEPPPAAPLARDALEATLAELGALLRREHREDYCGIVYADDLSDPTLVKVYDPGNLGSSCSHGEPGRHLPRWVFSLDPPGPVGVDEPVPGARLRWWRRLTGRAPPA